ncbi:MAG TPA: esterase-like activity of phytase family protein [Candidatus Limnocylindrales bacterium]|nr:esterase-like activity of phytase family protein [Candidatus Limnocylindrales bacterium]
MRRAFKTSLAAGAIAVAAFNTAAVSAADPGITLVGQGSVSGTAMDRSGFTGNICQASDPTACVPAAILGGFGSDIAYTGRDSIFVAAPDRGPYDGLTDVPYVDRFHYLRITTDIGAAFPNVRVKLLDTDTLRGRHGTPFVGAAGSYADGTRLDPEGIRVSRQGTLYISDEYGPYVLEFSREGRLLRRIRVPADFAIANPSADPTTELTGNSSGRQANRGMEGLAISPDGSTLYGIMQNALLQDEALVPGTTDRRSLYTRILKIDLRTGRTREFAYRLEATNRGQGVSEILAVNDHELLVLERDNRSNLQTPPQAPTRKAIFKITIDETTTDVSDITLGATALPAGVVPVAKTMFIDLLDPAFGLAATIPEKLEGMAWGRDLEDGRHLLYVTSDNDLNPALDSRIYAFAVTDEAADVTAQVIRNPVFGHGRGH